MANINDVISITPYKELHDGSKSIHDHTREGYSVPDKVIAYLQTAVPFLMALGIYDHPFKEGVRLLGPYWFTDGKYCWDRDTWKYVVKYHLVLPEEFIDHVMSDEGTAFLEKCVSEHKTWGQIIHRWKQQPNTLCLLPDDAGQIELEDF